MHTTSRAVALLAFLALSCARQAPVSPFAFTSDAATGAFAYTSPAAAAGGGTGRRFRAETDPSTGVLAVVRADGSRVALRPAGGPLRPGRGFLRDGAVVFPGDVGELVQRARADGVKEDAILAVAPADAVAFAWTLELSPGLAATLEASGEIEIRRAARDPFLGAAAADAATEMRMARARAAARGELLFRLPAPVVTAADGAALPARFTLDGARLRLEVSGLARAALPVDVDPTVVVASAADLASAGALEWNVDAESSTGGRILRHPISGGANGSWSLGGNLPEAGRTGHVLVAAGGHLFALGGTGTSHTPIEHATVGGGAVGTWQPNPTQPAFLDNLVQFGAVAFGGHVYVFGGFPGLAEVRSAPILADGAVGDFTTLPVTLPTPRHGFGFAAANGYLYVVGGVDGGGAPLVDVLVAALQPGGGLSPFTPTTPLPAPRVQPAVTAYGGSLYVTGGMATNGTGHVAETLVAPLSTSTGAAGAFRQAAASPIPRARHQAVAHGGWLYLLGGFTAPGTLTADVSAAPILPSGLVGPWIAGTSIGALLGSTANAVPTADFGAVAVDDLILAVGGANPAGQTTNLLRASPLGRNRQGGAQGDVFGGTFPNAPSVTCAGAVAANGYLYVLGGENDDGTYRNQIAWAPITATGTGSWTVAAQTLSEARCTQAVAFNRRIYAVLGEKLGAQASAAVDWFEVDPATGAPVNGTQGSTTLAAGLARRDAAVAVAFGTIYVVGGRNSANTVYNEILWSQLAGGGVPGAFNVFTIDPAYMPFGWRARYGVAATAWGDHLYAAGGASEIYVGNPTPQTSVVWWQVAGAAPIPPSGAPSAPLPWGRAWATAEAHAGWLYVHGGTDLASGTQPDVLAYPIGEYGALGPFVLSSSSSGNQTYRHASALADGVVYETPGTPSVAGGASRWTRGALAWGGGAGAFSDGTPFTGYPVSNGAAYHCAVSTGGRVVQILGSPVAGLVASAPVSEDGTVGAWTTEPSLVNPRYGHACAVGDGYVYVVGGLLSGGSTVATTLEYARILPDGHLGPWTAVPAPVRGAQGAAVVHRGWLYYGGGENTALAQPATNGTTTGGGMAGSTKLWAGQIQPDGSVALALNAQALPFQAHSLALAANAGWLYAVGGANGTTGSLSYAVNSAPLAGSSVGSWRTVATLPQRRAGHAVIALDGWLTVTGGYSTSSAIWARTAYAPFLADGKLGNFSEGTATARARWGHSAAAASGWLVVTGGADGAGGTSVELAPLRAPAARGTWSRLFDTGGNAQSFDALAWNETPGSRGRVSARVRAAPWQGTFGAPTELGTLTSGDSSTLAATGDRYLWLQLTLDDGDAAVLDVDRAQELPGYAAEQGVEDVALTWTEAPATQLGFSSAPVTAAAGACSAPITVAAMDSGRGVHAVAAPVDVSLASSSGSARFFADADCTVPITGVTIPAGGSTAAFHVEDTTAGTATVTASTTALAGAIATQDETVVPATPVRLAFAAQPPASVTAATPFGATVVIEDAYGNATGAGTDRIVLGLSAGGSGAVLTGTTYLDAAAGVAAFANLNVDRVGQGFTLVASATGLAGATSSAFDVQAGPPSRLAFTVGPLASSAGQALSPALQVAVQDAAGNVVTSAAPAVTLSIYSTSVPGPVLSGTLVRAASAGVATFDDVSLDLAGSYRLRASATGLAGAISTSFGVAAGPPAVLIFTAQPPASTASEQPFAVTVAVQDGFRNTIASPSLAVALALSGPAGATLSGGGSVTTAGGVASFPAVSVDRAAGGYALTASALGVAGASSTSFAVHPGAPTRLVFLDAPTDVTAGEVIAPAVRVALADAAGNVANAGAHTITIAVDDGPAGAALGGSTSVFLPPDGIATFADLTLDRAGTYTLAATGLGTTVSAPFTVHPAAPFRLVYRTPPPGAVSSGQPFTAEVEVRDAYGNLAPAPAQSVSLALAGAPEGAALSGGGAVVTSGGVAAFTGLSIARAAPYLVVQASAAGLLPAASGVTVQPGAPARLEILQQPSSVEAGAAMSPPVRIGVTDAAGNAVADAEIAVTLALASGPPGAALLSGSGPVTPIAGVATFSPASNRAGGDYTLTASSPGLVSVTTAAYSVSPGPAAALTFASAPPAEVVSLSPFSVAVQVHDAFGNPLAMDGLIISLALAAGPGGGGLAGATGPVEASGGLATFSGLRLDRAGAGYTLVASAAGLTGATSTSVAVIPGAPASLAFVEAPGAITAGAPFAADVRVALLDAAGNLATQATTPVTLAVANGAATLVGAATHDASGGSARFPGVTLHAAGTFQLEASAGGLPGATSAPFEVAAGPVASLAFTVQPPAEVQSGLGFGATVVARDAYGNLATGGEDVASLGVASGPAGGALSGTTSASLSGGTAGFASLLLDRAGSYRLRATAGAATATSEPVAVIAGPAARLVFLAQPQDGVAGVELAPPPEVGFVDAAGNAAGGFGVVTVSLDGAALAGTTTRFPVGGAAAFDDLVVAQAGSGYVLHATAPGLAGDASTPFAIRPGPVAWLGFTAAPSAVAVGACAGPFTLSARDAEGNAAEGIAPVAVDLSALPAALAFHAGAGCVAPIAAVTLPAGAATVSFWVRASAADAFTVEAATAGAPPATTLVTASAPPPPPPLQLTPGTATVGAGASVQLAATGGVGPYTWSMQAAPSGGRVDGSGAYVAGSVGGVTDVVRVTDSAGTSVTASIAVTGGGGGGDPGGGDPGGAKPGGGGCASGSGGPLSLAVVLALALGRRRRRTGA